MEKLKVLHLFQSYLPPTENWCYNLLRHTPGVEVHVFGSSYLKYNFYHPDFRFVENYYAGLTQMKMDLPSGKIGSYLKLATLKGISLVLGNEKQALRQYVKDHNIDVVHAHFADVGWRYRFLADSCKMPYVVSFYGWDYEQLPYLWPRYKQYFRRLFCLADALFCEGPHGAETLKKHGCPAEKIKIVKLGVEVKRIPFYNRTKKEGELRLVQLATFNEKKGHIYTVMAFEEALKTCPNMHLTLAGGMGTEKKKIMDYVKAKGLENRIAILEPIDWTERHSFLRSFQVFIHPSCYAKDKDCEGGAPVVLLDAQATGMPVISTTHCDIPMEVVHESTGMLSPEKDIFGLANHIRQFYAMNQDCYNAFALQARKWMVEEFEVSVNAARAGEYYRQILQRL